MTLALALALTLTPTLTLTLIITPTLPLPLTPTPTHTHTHTHTLQAWLSLTEEEARRENASEQGWATLRVVHQKHALTLPP